MDSSVAVYTYVGVVVAAAIGALSWTLWWLNSTSRRRKAILRSRTFRSVLGQTPLDDDQEVALERGLQSVDRGFTVTRKLLVPIIVVLTGLALALPFLSFVPSVFVTLLAALMTVFIGVAAKPVLENAMSGLVISASRLFRIGDTIMIDDRYGTVEDITTTHTTVKLWDWKRFVVPNSQMLNREIVNYSLFDTYVWAYVRFFVANDADLDLVERIAVQCPQQSVNYRDHEPPRFWVMDLGRDSVECWVAAWADTPSEAWALTSDTRKVLSRQLKEAGVSAHMNVHRLQTTTESGAPVTSGVNVAGAPELAAKVESGTVTTTDKK